MSHPPYHLRHNKAVDRFLFIDLISKINEVSNGAIASYTYHSLGGPFLEDFKLMHHYFPLINMVCIEKDLETHKRQKFNCPIKIFC